MAESAHIYQQYMKCKAGPGYGPGIPASLGRCSTTKLLRPMSTVNITSHIAESFKIKELFHNS